MCPDFELAQEEIIFGWREWEVERIGDIHLNMISDVGPVEEKERRFRGSVNDMNWYA
jgi:hypothetical protein